MRTTESQPSEIETVFKNHRCGPTDNSEGDSDSFTKAFPKPAPTTGTENIEEALRKEGYEPHFQRGSPSPNSHPQTQVGFIELSTKPSDISKIQNIVQAVDVPIPHRVITNKETTSLPASNNRSEKLTIIIIPSYNTGPTQRSRYEEFANRL